MEEQQVKAENQEVQKTAENEQVVQAEEKQEQNSSSEKYTMQHNRPDCIGCAACEAVAPEFWEMHEDGKSDIKNAKTLDNEWQELGIEEKDFEANKEAAESCPVNVIHLVNKETGEKII